MTDVVLPPTFEQTASFTPGKWEFREIYPYDDGLGYISADGHDIIHAGVSDLPAEENRANALLIAAAPTMADYIQKQANAGDDVARSILEQINACG